MHEKGVVGTSADHSDLDPLLFVPPGVTINNVQFAPGVEIVDGKVLQDSERTLVDALVDVAPADLPLADGVIDEGLGLGDTAA